MLDEKLLKVRQDILEKFSDLVFNEEKHTYFVGSRQYPSVSGILKNFSEPFDPNAARRYAEKNGFDESQVKLAWSGEGDIANANGHRVHLFGEEYVNWKYLGIGDKPVVSCKQSLGALQFWNRLPNRFYPIFTELRMYNEKLGYAGTADILCYDLKTDKLVIMDYKTNKSIINEYSSPLLNIDPEYNLKQDNFGKYTLQFNLYQILLEELGYQVSGRILIWLREQEKNKEDGTANLYKTMQTLDVTTSLRTYFENNPLKKM